MQSYHSNSVQSLLGSHRQQSWGRHREWRQSRWAPSLATKRWYPPACHHNRPQRMMPGYSSSCHPISWSACWKCIAKQKHLCLAIVCCSWEFWCPAMDACNTTRRVPKIVGMISSITANVCQYGLACSKTFLAFNTRYVAHCRQFWKVFQDHVQTAVDLYQPDAKLRSVMAPLAFLSKR